MGELEGVKKVGPAGWSTWWTCPHMFLACFLLPAYLVLVVSHLTPRYGKYYLDIPFVLMGIAFLGIMATSSYFTSKLCVGPAARHDERAFSLLMDITALLTVFAYVLWFWRLALDPELIRNVVVGSALHVRQDISTVPGLTTLTQLGFVYSTMYALSKWVWRIPVARRHTFYFAIIAVLTGFRTIAWGERLASIELILPMVLVYVCHNGPRRPAGKWLVAMAPFVAVFMMLLFFGATEVFRSWGKQQATADSVVSFMSDRLLYYYFSSLNNGCGLLQEFPWPQWDMQFTLKWVYTFPGLGSWVASHVQVSGAEALFLRHYADMEFTTYTGIFPVFYDWGLWPGLMIAVLLGGIMGLAYRQFREGCGFGLWVYPLLYLHLLEILRIFYLGYSRIIPIVLGVAIVWWTIGRSRLRTVRAS